MEHKTKHHPAGFSRLGRIYKCPGSLQECQKAGVKDRPDEDNRGTILHKAVEFEVFDGLSDREAIAVREAIEFQDAKVKAYGRKVLGEAREKTLDLHRRNDEVLCWGTIDRMVVLGGPNNGGPAGLDIQDNKFHPTGYIPENDTLYQLAAQCCAALQEYNTANAAMARAYAAFGGYEYTFLLRRSDLPGWLQHLEDIVDAAYHKNPIYRPSVEACKYCEAKATCEHAAKEAENIPAVIGQQGTGIVAHPDGRVEVTNDQRVCETHLKLKQLEDWLKAAKTEFKQLVLAAFDQGWESAYLTTKNSGRMPHLDYEKVWDSLTEEEVHLLRAECLKHFGMGDLEKVAVTASPDEKASAVKRALREKLELAGALTYKAKSPSIQKKRGVKNG